jgi:hypothetical protein
VRILNHRALRANEETKKTKTKITARFAQGAKETGTKAKTTSMEIR